MGVRSTFYTLRGSGEGEERLLHRPLHERDLVVVARQRLGSFHGERRRFERGPWRAWVKSARAPALPGAAELARRAAELGVTLFYVTNRDADEEEATRANLARAPGPPPGTLATTPLPFWRRSSSARSAVYVVVEIHFRPP